MIAGTISPNPMYKCPDQMIKVQTTPLNANVSCKYKQVALFGVSRIFSNFIRSDGSLHTRNKSKVSNRLFSSSIA